MKKFLVQFIITLFIFSLLIYGSSSDYMGEVAVLKEVNGPNIVIESETEGRTRIQTQADLSALLEVDTVYVVKYSKKKLSNKIKLIEIRPHNE